MANRKTYRLDLEIGGKVNPSLAQAQAAACSYLKNISRFTNVVKASAVGTFAGIMVNRAKDAAINFGKGTLEAASNLQETRGKINEVFKDSSSILHQWSKSSTRTMGLSQQAALDAAALYGDMATGMNISRQRAAQMAMTLTQLGADLSSFKNISNDVAQTALKSVFTGETESLKNLGTTMTQATLQEYAYSIGIKKKINKMKEAEKVELRYRFVLAKTKNSQGDYIRTALNAANAQRTFQQSTADLQAKIGENFLPYYAKALNTANKWLMANSDNIVKATAIAAKNFSNVYHSINNISTLIKAAAIPAVTVLGGAFTGLLIGEMGTFINLARSIPPIINAWTVSTWQNVWANRALKAAMLGTGYGLLIVGLTELIIHWKEVCSWIHKCTDAARVFFRTRGNAKQYITPQRYTEMSAKHALGTHSFVGGSTWVGENGPELINLPRGTEIMSRNKSFAAAQATNFTMPITINIGGNANAETISNAAKEVMPNIKAQIDAYFRQKQRLGYSF